MNRFYALVASLALGLPSAAFAQTGGATIDARSSVFSSAAHPSGSLDASSLASYVIPLSPGINRLLTFTSVTGTVNPGASNHGADGGPAVGTGVDISSLGSISGIIDDTVFSLALMGAFVGSNPASGAAPARLNFSEGGGLGHSFSSISPLINQSFFIGDGLTGTGSGTQQQFLVPDGATHLQLGFADANEFSGIPFVGAPADYNDNTGSLNVGYSISSESAVPEPGAVFLFLPALAAVGILRRRRA